MPYNLIRDLDPHQSPDLHDRGLHYGDGIFETMLLQDGEIKYWPEHYQRLFNSAAKLHIDCPDINWFEQYLESYKKLNQRLTLKIILTRGSGGRGLSIPDQLPVNAYILKYESKAAYNQPVKAIFSCITLPINRNLSGIKHLNRLDYVLAARSLKDHPEFNEAVLSDTNGFIIESIINNLFFVKNGEIITPSLETSGVDGIMRQIILKNLKKNGKKVNIAKFKKDVLLDADECFVCNSVQGIRSVIQLENRKFNIGSLTTDLQNKFHGHSGS